MQNDDVAELSVEELNQKIQNKEDFILIDVRRNEEYDHSNIKSSVHIPLDELESRLNEFDPRKEYVLQCRSGGRSYSAARFLKSNGINNVYNLIGGLVDWSNKIDSSISVK